MPVIYSATWLLPIASHAIANGALVIEGDQIKAVGELAALRSIFPDAPHHDLGEAAIIPGLVNAHSHLELTAMRGFLDGEESDFFGWLRKLTIARLERMSDDDLYVSAAWGACEAARAGVTCLGDSSDSAATTMRALNEVGLRATVYQESFGPDPNLLQENFSKLLSNLDRLRKLETPLVRAGVSPHAPYTVCPAQLKMIAELAGKERLPLMMHAAESEAEEQFVRKGQGPFAEGLRKRAIDWQSPGVSTIKYLAGLGVFEAQTLLAHCITVDDADIELLSDKQVGVAHCPRSNAKLGHRRAPFSQFLRHKLRVGLGSDSVASNNSCDLLAEARFAVLNARSGAGANEMISAEEGLKTATLGGALAMGYEGRVGTLQEGRQADFAAIRLDGAHQLPIFDPADTLIFSSSGADVLLTVVAGKEIYRDGKVLTIDEDDLRTRIKMIAGRLSEGAD